MEMEVGWRRKLVEIPLDLGAKSCPPSSWGISPGVGPSQSRLGLRTYSMSVAPTQQARIAPRTTNWALHCMKIFEFNKSIGTYRYKYYFNLKCIAFFIKSNT
jgi:hypothetical protein